MSFTGFGPEALGFLSELAANNARPWFLANRKRYDKDVVTPLKALIEALLPALAAQDVPLTGDPAKSIFRIHRDVRFSADKQPYKTHAGAVLSRGGDKSASGVLYIHIAPEGSFLAAGFYHPEREQLGALREAIYTEPERFAGVRADLAAAGLALSAEDTLSRMPRGFEDAADTPHASALKLKSFVTTRALEPSALASPALVDDIAGFAAQALPLLRFGWSALTVLDPTALTRQK